MFLYFLLVIEGFIGLAIQMLMIRQLTPEVGSSAVSSSWIIGFFLLALSIGYKKGGEVSKKPLSVLGNNLIKVGIWSGVGLSSLFVFMFFQVLSPVTTLLSLILYCLVVIVPIAFWMGQSLPLLISESKWGERSSEVSGNALYLSTVGSFLGAILTTTVFLYFIGTTFTLMFVALLSLSIGFYLKKREKESAFLLSAIGIFLSISVNLGFSNLLNMTGSQYADIYVSEVPPSKEDESPSKVLIANNTIMSKLKEGKNDGWYLKQFNGLVNNLGLKNENILILGAGGFVAHLEDEDNDYTYVDIDPTLKEISEKQFIKRKIEEEFIVSDARRYLIDNEYQYNLIFLDAFSSQRSIPSHLVTKEFFGLLRGRLNLNGTLAVNTILNPNYDDDYSIRFHTTLMSAFPFCETRIRDRNSTVTNIVYFCEKKANIIETYSDQNNKNEIDFWK